MNDILLIFIGAVAASIPWMIFHGRTSFVNHKRLLVEKELSYAAGFDHARKLERLEPRAPNMTHTITTS